jgi:hypothetical protein
MAERRSKWDNPGDGSPVISAEAAAAGALLLTVSWRSYHTYLS